MIHVAEKGNCVIVGRGSQQFLKKRQDTLRVFLYAPREDKVRRLLSRGKSEKDAEELVDSVDRERADFIQKYFSADWPDRPIYHAMLNTAIGDECTADMILSLAHTYQTRCAPCRQSARIVGTAQIFGSRCRIAELLRYEPGGEGAQAAHNILDRIQSFALR